MTHSTLQLQPESSYSPSAPLAWRLGSHSGVPPLSTPSRPPPTAALQSSTSGSSPLGAGSPVPLDQFMAGNSIVLGEYRRVKAQWHAAQVQLQGMEALREELGMARRQMQAQQEEQVGVCMRPWGGGVCMWPCGGGGAGGCVCGRVEGEEQVGVYAAVVGEEETVAGGWI